MRKKLLPILIVVLILWFAAVISVPDEVMAEGLAQMPTVDIPTVTGTPSRAHDYREG